jgi:hypothetical protein
VYNVRSYLLLIFVAPFTLFYAKFAVGRKIYLWKSLLHFVPLAVMSGLYLLLWSCSPHIPSCYDINELLGYFSDYPLYVTYFVLLMTVFTAQVFTYFSTALLYILQMRRLYRLHHKPMKPLNRLLAMDFLFLCYPLLCMVFMSYNNNVMLGMAHNFLIAAEITAISTLSMNLRLPLPTAFMVNSSDLLRMNVADTGSPNATDAKILKKLFEEKHIYRHPDLILEYIIKKCNSNRTYVSSCINRHYGCSFKQLVLRYRLLAAQELLLKPD